MPIGIPPVGSGSGGYIMAPVDVVPYITSWYSFPIASLAVSGTSTANVQSLAFGFRAPINSAITLIRFSVAVTAGTLASGDIVFELMAATQGAGYSPYPPPTGGTVIQTLQAPAISTTGYYEITASPSINNMTEGQYYFIRIRNLNSTPSANYIAVRSATVPQWDFYAPTVASAAASASSWSTFNRVLAMVVRVLDVESPGSYYLIGQLSDFAFSNVIQSYGTGSTARLGGVRITVPSEYDLRVRGVTCITWGAGTGTSGAVSIWAVSNNTEIASSEVLPASILRYQAQRTFWFSNPVTLSAGLDYRIVFKPTGGDSSNYVGWRYMNVDSTYSPTSSFPLNPRSTYSIDGGANWTDHSGNVQAPPTLILWLDRSQPIVPTGGGGGGITGFAPVFWRGVET